jgi:hypothetical protein
MATVSGLLRVGEATATVRTIGARQRGSMLWYYAMIFATFGGGALGGNLIARYVTHSDPEIGAGWGFVAGVILYALTARRLSLALFRSRMERKGHPPLFQLEMDVTPEALLYRLGDVRQTAPWSAVSELFESRGYWIFLVQSSPFFAPKRFFENRAAEKAFLRAALECMSEDARSRSQQAVAFAKAA